MLEEYNKYKDKQAEIALQLTWVIPLLVVVAFIVFLIGVLTY